MPGSRNIEPGTNATSITVPKEEPPMSLEQLRSELNKLHKQRLEIQQNPASRPDELAEVNRQIAQAQTCFALAMRNFKPVSVPQAERAAKVQQTGNFSGL